MILERNKGCLFAAMERLGPLPSSQPSPCRGRGAIEQIDSTQKVAIKAETLFGNVTKIS